MISNKVGLNHAKPLYFSSILWTNFLVNRILFTDWNRSMHDLVSLFVCFVRSSYIFMIILLCCVLMQFGLLLLDIKFSIFHNWLVWSYLQLSVMNGLVRDFMVISCFLLWKITLHEVIFSNQSTSTNNSI